MRHRSCIMIGVFVCVCIGSCGAREHKVDPTSKPSADTDANTPPTRAANTARLRAPAGFLWIDAASGFRHGAPLIAGERVAIGGEVTGGTPPYHIVFTSAAPNADPAISAQLTLPKRGRRTHHFVAETTLAQTAPSGSYVLKLELQDSTGVRLAITGPTFTVVGHDSPQNTVTAQTLHIVDIAGRARKKFYRGETITVVANRAAKNYQFVLRSPTGHLLQHRDVPGGDRFRHSLAVPRLARSGTYGVGVKADDDALIAELHIASPPFAAVKRLTVDKLHVYSQAGGRLKRFGLLYVGEDITLEARIAGVAKTATVVARIREGDIVHEQTLGRVRPVEVSPNARVYARGTWSLPKNMKPGRYYIEVEATEGDDVAQLFRDTVFIP